MIKYYISKFSIIKVVGEVNILDFLGRYLTIKKIGKHFFANCPFHPDKNPSFIINELKCYFYCFGCKATGNIIHFYQKFHNVDFYTSIHYISSLYNIKLEYEYNNSNNLFFNKEKIDVSILQKINNFFLESLYKLKNENKIKNYLKKHNLSLQTLKQFEIGYCPSSLSMLRNFINTLKNNEINNLMEIGIIKCYNNNNNYSCIFTDRLIFPILDSKGIILGFGGRDLSSQSLYKYINSPNSITFDKQKILYGLSHVIKKDPYPKKILVVEGYLDVISLHQAGISYAVGLLGSNLSNYQLTILLNKTKHLIFCYDGDLAGRLAAWDTIKKIIPYIKDDHQINFVFLPDKEDPNSLINKDNNMDFESRLDKSIPFFDYIYNHLYKEIIKPNNIYSQIMFVKKLINFIKPMISRYFKSYLFYKLKNNFDFVDINLFDDEADKLSSQNKPTKPTFKNNLILLVSLLIQNPILYKLATPLLSLINHNKNKYIQLFIYLVKLLQEHEYINNTGKLLEFLREDSNIKHITKYATIDFHVAQNKLNQFFVDLIYYFHKMDLKNQLDELKNLEKTTVLNKDHKEKIWELIKKMKNINQN